MISKHTQVTIKTVAKEAGVSISTVSRVLNGNSNVDENLSRKVNEAVKKLAYKPNLAARSMKGRKTNIIGCLVPDINIQFFKDFIAGVVEEAGENGYYVLITSSNRSIKEEEENLIKFSQSMIDGLIYSPISQIESDFVNDMVTNIPTIITFRSETHENVPYITYDNRKGGYIAAKYLLSLGRRNIAYLAELYENDMTKDEFFNYAMKGPFGIYSSIDRYSGYIKAHEELGLEINKDLICMNAGHTFELGFNAIKELISLSYDVDGLIAANDMVAFGAMNFLKSQGIIIPQDISVIGYDDGEITNQIEPRLTSVNQDAKKLGSKSVKNIISLIKGQAVESQTMDVCLNVRDSTSRKL